MTGSAIASNVKRITKGNESRTNVTCGAIYYDEWNFALCDTKIQNFGSLWFLN